MAKLDTSYILHSWERLTDNLSDLTELECEELLETERAGANRINYIVRIYSRKNKLRGKRELNKIIKKG